MVAIFAILIFVVYLAFGFPMDAKPAKEEKKSPKYEAQMKKLWQVAQTSMKERKPFRAEKALLTILKFDEKNAVAYNRLGILYAKDKRYDEAVECFEIAQSLDNNPASIHNAGLIYLETGAYEKAEMAFQQAIELEGDVPARYMALAKAEEKLGNYKKAVEALENAYELDPSVTVLRQILAIYETTGDTEAATATTARIEAQIARDTRVRRKRSAVKAASKGAPRAEVAGTPVQPKVTAGSAAAGRRVATSTMVAGHGVAGGGKAAGVTSAATARRVSTTTNRVAGAGAAGVAAGGKSAARAAGKAKPVTIATPVAKKAPVKRRRLM